MKLNRSLGFYLLACSALCGVIAYDFYQSEIQTAKKVAEQLDLTLESIEIPIETKVASFLCISIAVAGVICLRDYFRQAAQSNLPGAAQKSSGATQKSARPK